MCEAHHQLWLICDSFAVEMQLRGLRTQTFQEKNVTSKRQTKQQKKSLCEVVDCFEVTRPFRVLTLA